MFVSIVETVNGPNGVIPPSQGCILRMTMKSNKRLAGGVYVSFSQKALKFFDELPNGKFSPIIDVSGNQLFNCLQPRIVKSAFEVMDGIPNHEREIIENEGILEGMYQSLSSMLRVNLNLGSVCSIKRGNAPFNIMDVHLGPLNLQP